MSEPTTHHDGFPSSRVYELAGKYGHRVMLISDLITYGNGAAGAWATTYGRLRNRVEQSETESERLINQHQLDLFESDPQIMSIRFEVSEGPADWTQILDAIERAVAKVDLKFTLADGYLKTERGVLYMLGFYGSQSDALRIQEIMADEETA